MLETKAHLSIYMSSLKQSLKTLINDVILQRAGLKLYSTRAFGRDITLDIKNLIASPKVMFDVGANVGQTVELWTREFDAPTIHSFEPVKRLFDELNSKHQNNAVCVHAGVGDENTRMTIHYGKHDVSHSFNKDEYGLGSEESNVVTLDTYCGQKNISKIDVLKIDVEGFEHQVLKGAEKLLSNHQIDILEIEVGFDPKGCYTFYPDIAEALRKHNYHTLGFYDQTTQWNGGAELLFCNVLFARDGLTF